MLRTEALKRMHMGIKVVHPIFKNKPLYEKDNKFFVDMSDEEFNSKGKYDIEISQKSGIFTSSEYEDGWEVYKKFAYDGFYKVEIIESEIKGERVFKEKIHLKNSVAGLVEDNCGKFAIVKQFRPCTGETLYEIPAGVLDKDKSITHILLEELYNQCNLKEDDFYHIKSEPIFRYYPICGCSDTITEIYYVQLKTQGFSVSVKISDTIEVIWLDLNELKEYVEKGLIKDGKTLLAISYIEKLHLQRLME